MGLGFWGLGFGVLAQTPNPQSPIPNPQSPFLYKYFSRNYLYLFRIDNNIEN